MIDKYVIPATEVREMTSKSIAQEYQISIALPYSYPEQEGRKYPAVYLLDANWYFGMVTDTVRIMSLCASLPEVIVVGIGYPYGEPLLANFPKLWQSRQRDCTPVQDEASQRGDREWLKVEIKHGGASNFLQFISDDLIPMIETEYRVEPGERTLIGHSSTGLFGLYTFLQQPELFKNYVILSFNPSFGNEIIFEYLHTFLDTHDDVSANVYFGVGLEEESEGFPAVSGLVQVAGILERKGYKSLKLTKKIHEGTDHCGVTAPLIQDGLQTVFSDYPKNELW